MNLVMDGLLTLKLLIAFLVSETRSPASPPWIPLTLVGKFSYPLLPQTVPSWALPLLALLLPILIFIVVKVVKKRSALELTRLILTLCSSVLLTALITNVIKVTVSRPRPNYLSACFGSSTPSYQGGNSFGGFPICTTGSNLNEHLKSFPSGHSSFAASGLGFLTYYLLGLTKCYAGPSSTGRLVLSLLPTLVAILVGISRVKDSWHHPSDVAVGLGLGFLISFLFYRILYGSFSQRDCDIPLAEAPEASRLLRNSSRQESDQVERSIQLHVKTVDPV